MSYHPARLLRGLTILLLVGLVGTPALAQHEAEEEAAHEAAEEWLVLYDDGDTEATWDEAALVFQEQIPQQQWDAQVEQIRAGLGAPEERTLLDKRYTEELPDVPEGEYVIIQYQTQYENARTTETLTMRFDADDDAWRTAGYFVDPDEEQ